MTEWEDDAFILSARAHGETGAIVEFLTENHGRHAAHIAGAASRRIKPFLQAGARVHRAQLQASFGQYRGLQGRIGGDAQGLHQFAAEPDAVAVAPGRDGDGGGLHGLKYIQRISIRQAAGRSRPMHCPR